MADENRVFDDLVELHIDLGLFVMDAETGFRGANLGEALAWEEAYGPCTDPFAETRGAPDWIDALVQAAAAEHTLEDAVVALKDRLITDPDLSDATERELLEALVRQPLSTTMADADDPTAALRRVCAALISSPQFTMTGAPAPARAGTVMPLTIPGSTRAALCEELEHAMYPSGGAACIDGALRLDAVN